MVKEQDLNEHTIYLPISKTELIKQSNCSINKNTIR